MPGAVLFFHLLCMCLRFSVSVPVPPLQCLRSSVSVPVSPLQYLISSASARMECLFSPHAQSVSAFSSYLCVIHLFTQISTLQTHTNFFPGTTPQLSWPPLSPVEPRCLLFHNFCHLPYFLIFTPFLPFTDCPDTRQVCKADICITC